MCKLTDTQDDFAFHFLDDIKKPVVRLNAIGRQLRSSNTYYWDNANRQPGCYLFQYTLGGSGTVKIGGEEYTVDRGKGFFLKIPGEECYYFDEKRNEAPWEFIYIMFECNGAEEYCMYIENHLGKIIGLPVWHQAVRLLFEIHGQAKKQMLSPFLLNGKVFEFLCILCSVKKEIGNADPALVINAKAYMEENYGRPIGISDVAEWLEVSQSHLSREFYKITGVKPIEYMTKLRLTHAVDLLSTTSGRLDEISASSGFSSTNYFNKVFKKHMGMTPAQFRKYIKSEGYSRFQV